MYFKLKSNARIKHFIHQHVKMPPSACHSQQLLVSCHSQRKYPDQDIKRLIRFATYVKSSREIRKKGENQYVYIPILKSWQERK